MTTAERRAASQRMTKCACGNVAGLGQAQCGACRRDDDADARLAAMDEFFNSGPYSHAERVAFGMGYDAGQKRGPANRP